MQHSTACVSEAEPCHMHPSHCLLRNAVVYCTDRLRLRGQPVIADHCYPVFIPLLFTSASLIYMHKSCQGIPANTAMQAS